MFIILIVKNRLETTRIQDQVGSTSYFVLLTARKRGCVESITEEELIIGDLFANDNDVFVLLCHFVNESLPPPPH